MALLGLPWGSMGLPLEFRCGSAWALFGFAVLEIATYKLTSFFNYFLQVINFKDDDDTNDDMQIVKKTFFTGMLFIRFVTLLLQFFIIIVYADIRNDLKLEYSALSNCRKQ